MGCFSCFDTPHEVANPETSSSYSVNQLESKRVANSTGKKTVYSSDESNKPAKMFSFLELAIATQNFKEVNLIGEGGFGNVYKGRLATGQVVAVKKLNQEGIQGSHEFLIEVLMLSMCKHPNLVTLVGYCAEGDERLLVYEYMVNGSLEDHLFDFSPDRPPLDWHTRIKIAVGAAKGLTYLHDVASPPVIYRDMKAANVLLDDDFNPKLSDFGLAKLGPVGANTHVSTRVMGTYGYCAPDYAMSGKLTLKSDIYSFGVLLLELITGRRAFDSSKLGEEQRLTTWSRPFMNDRRKYRKLADPTLEGRFPPRAFHQLVVVTSMCLHEQANVRPIIADVVIALKHVATQPFASKLEPNIMSSPPPSPSSSKQDTGTEKWFQ